MILWPSGVEGVRAFNAMFLGFGVISWRNRFMALALKHTIFQGLSLSRVSEAKMAHGFECMCKNYCEESTMRRCRGAPLVRP
eukprot:2020117-Amphidinium_carterae.1